MGDDYPCLTCLTHQIGEDLCELHPEASAFHDRMYSISKKINPKMSQVNQLDDICTWVTLHPNQAQTTAMYILGCICDKCGNQVTVTLCTQCAQNWGGNAPNARCGSCNGTLSWQLHDITSGEALTHINPSRL